MIITKLIGGLGNQMFQYAAARGYQRKKNERLILDTRLLIDRENNVVNAGQRPFALGIFNQLKAEMISLDLIHTLNKTGWQYRLKNKIFERLAHTFVQDVMKPVELKPVKKKNVILSGFFQSEQYFSGVREDIIRDFTFPALDASNSAIKAKILGSENTLSIHIRRGDYLDGNNKNTFASVNLLYYKNALQTLRQLLGINRFAAFVFTDDPEWVESNLIDPSLDITIVEGNLEMNSWKDMCLMSYCRHHIIANSSFSWWGAWLGNDRGITLAPKYWFLPSTYTYDIHHIIPSHWKIIDYSL